MWKIKRILLKVAITFLSLIILTVAAKSFYNPQQAIKIYQAHEQISNAESEYIISKEAIMSKLKAKSQIVSLEQQLNKTDTIVDSNWLGERQTELTIKGSYKMGLETKDIHINHIDTSTGIVYIKLPAPILISLTLPYDQIEFDKTQGFFRLAMDDSEEKKFYKAVHKNIEQELMSNKEVIKLADTYNRDAVEDILRLIPNVKAIIFE
jgi:hypothetical protein